MEVQCFEIKTEADSNDITLCSDDDKPSTGMFAVSDSDVKPWPWPWPEARKCCPWPWPWP